MAWGYVGGHRGGKLPKPQLDLMRAAAGRGLATGKARRASAQPRSMQASNVYSGGGGSVPAAPVSTLANVPKSPILDDLIKRGIVKEGMPTEQILSLVQLATVGQQSG